MNVNISPSACREQRVRINAMVDCFICDSCGLNKDLHTFSSEDQMENILGFWGHMNSDAITNPPFVV